MTDTAASTSRRTALKGTLGAGLTGAFAVAAAPAASAAVTSAYPGQDAFVRVNTTTTWLGTDLSRSVDSWATAYTPYPQTWLSKMTYSQEKDLIGRLDTQATLNTRVRVRQISGSWAKVSVLNQKAPNSYGYMTSWIPKSHVVRDTVTESMMKSGKVGRVTAKNTLLYTDSGLENALMRVPFGTELPYYSYTWSTAVVHATGYGKLYARRSDLSMWPAPRGTAAQAIATAKSFVDVPYLWAGTTPFGFDCSGFTYTVLRAHGILIPRDAGPQRDYSGLPWVSRANLRPGDLVFWSVSRGSSRVRHVGLYIGNGKIVHAPDVGTSVRIDPLSAPGDSTYAGAVRPPYAG